MQIHPLSDLHNEFAPFTPEVRDAATPPQTVRVLSATPLSARGLWV